MAIYHQTTKMVKRSEGRNAVAAAAYRAGISLYEEATGLTHDYSKKMGVEHSEILAPDHVPDWVFDRQRLWNEVERCENRKDAQVAREVEVGLPIELSKSEQIELLRDFVKREFVARGMVADFSLHLDNSENPHAHILLTTRDITDDGFGQKNRNWNDRAELMGWRRGWAEVTNEHLAQAGLGVRIDHRSYKEQRLGLIPGRKIGLGLDRQHDERLPSFLADRVAEQQQIMGANGEQILKDPSLALKALTHGQATFTHHDIARFLNTRTDGAEQFQAAYLKVTTSPELVGLGLDDQGRQRFTTREMFERERGMLADAERLSVRRGHGVSRGRQASVLSNNRLSDEQRQAFEHVTGAGDLKSLVGVAGSGKSTALSAMREAWEAEGLSVKGAALSGIAAENLQVASGIQARTLASYELAWNGGRDPLTSRDVLVIDEAGMIGTRQLARVLEVAEKAHAKVVLVGDPEQLQAIEAGAPFRGIAAAHGVAELAQVRRQRQEWQRTATGQLASGRTAEALAAYQNQHSIVAVEQRGDARSALLARWARDAKAEPDGSQLVLAYTRDDVQALNTAVRTLRQQTGQLGKGQVIATAQGQKEFAVNDRIRFLRNEKALGVKNGSLGTVERIEGGVIQVKLDGPADTRVAVDTKFYQHLDHGYAATVHKAQGTTVDRTYVLATPHFDRHTTYVAMSRHREAATVFYAADDFGGRGGRLDADQVQARFVERLSRAQAKDLVHDYLEAVSAAPGIDATPAPKQTLEEIRRAGREQWRRERELAKQSGQAMASSSELTAKPDRFKGLKLKSTRGVEADARATLDRTVGPSTETPAARRSSELIRALDGYARAYSDAVRMRDQNLPVLPHQRAEMKKATAELERVHPGATRDLLNAVKYERGTLQILRSPAGPERAGELLKTLEHEERVRTNPELKAERVVKIWQGLETEHEKLRGYEHEGPRKRIEKELQSLTRDIKADPELGGRVRQLQIELGISRRLERVLEERDLDRALRLSIDRGRDFGLSL
jgi:Ti-type conjugative transfer relaxase TraA